MKLIHAAAAAGLSLILVAPAHAGSSFLGDTVDGSYFFPNTGSLYQDDGSAVVSPDASFFFSTGLPNVTADVTGDQITLTFDADGGSFTPATFNGVVITDLSANDITGAVLDGSSTAAPPVSFTSDSVDINLQGLSLGTADTIVVDVSFGSAAPEPATWALMLAGFGGLGLALRSRRRAVGAAA